MADQSSDAHDPFAFLKTFWAQMQLPGIGAGGKTAGFSASDFMSPLFSAEKIDERLNQLKLVEGWLSLNLNILQMQIKTLEMQKAGLSAVRSAASAVGVGPADSGAQPAANPFLNPAAWMDLMQAQMQLWQKTAGTVLDPRGSKPKKK